MTREELLAWVKEQPQDEQTEMLLELILQLPKEEQYAALLALHDAYYDPFTDSPTLDR